MSTLSVDLCGFINGSSGKGGGGDAVGEVSQTVARSCPVTKDVCA